MATAIDISTARQYVEYLAGDFYPAGSNQSDYWRWLASSGTGFGAEMISHERSDQLSKQYRCQIRQCFHNCRKILTKRPDLRYFEGYALSMIPVHHAWLVDIDGRVIDPTWSRITFRHVIDYFGVEITAEEIDRYNRNPVYEAAGSLNLKFQESHTRGEIHV